MSKRGALNARYPHVLPVHHIILPELIPHNPVSWVWFAWKFMSQWPSVSKTTVEYKDGLFLVNDPRDMMTLWDEGFFGKGTMSRSEPSWLDRTQKRLGIGEFKNLTIEEITSIRREERKKFKKERAKLEKKKQELKKQGVVDPLLEDKLMLKELRDKDINVKVERETDVRLEDDALVHDGELINIEQVQLQPCEAFFLKFALQCVDVVLDTQSLNSKELLDLIWNRRADDQFILNYVVYHHYRSLGWCVRSAIKFGSDFLLYKRGPPFHHAEFALSVIPNYADDSKNHETARNFTWLSGLNRVVAGVRKNLVLVFVDVPSQEKIDRTTDIMQLLELYKINEVLYRRWVPNRNRD
jgi:tRNA-splicing endonuclease subunit Sen2